MKNISSLLLSFVVSFEIKTCFSTSSAVVEEKSLFLQPHTVLKESKNHLPKCASSLLSVFLLFFASLQLVTIKPPVQLLQCFSSYEGKIRWEIKIRRRSREKMLKLNYFFWFQFKEKDCRNAMNEFKNQQMYQHFSCFIPPHVSHSFSRFFKRLS